MTDSTFRKRADESEQRLESLSVAERAELDDLSYYKTPQFATPEELPLDEFRSCEVGFTWERNRETTDEVRRNAAIDVTDVTEIPGDLSLGENVWFRLQFAIPDSMAGRPVYLSFAAEPLRGAEGGMGPPRVECLCYRDGEPWKAFDDGHTDMLLTEDSQGGEQFDLLVEAGTTTLWGLLDVEEFILDTAELYAVRENVMQLSRNVSLLNSLRKDIPDDSINVGKILRALSDASHIFAYDASDEQAYAESARAALDRLDTLKESLTSDLTGQEITAIGHAHIDLAWLWPWSETVRKGARSFTNVLRLMEQYPEFTFLQSQPHLYELIRNRYPDVFQQIEAQIDEDSWHPLGALWVESDTNIAGGEALARQFLLGKRYFRDEFDVDPQITFIPDVFGYTAALPTIAQAADCPYFFTQKMSWNEENEFPHSTFTWEGLDGSSVLTHFPPVETYNGEMTVDQIRKSVTNHDENDVLDESAYLYGWGDGGGGPTREMLENRKIIDEIGSLPDVSTGSLTGFFERLEPVADDLPTWIGELYLEKHRATLTTQARTKRNNRKGEFALRDAELWSSLALSDGEFDYAHESLERAWKVLLFNQFHDILPGSSVGEVYADADRDYEQMFETIEEVKTDALDALAPAADRSDRLMVTNSLSWTRSPVVKVDADDYSVDADEAVVARTKNGTSLPVQRSEVDGTDTFLFEAKDVPPLGVTSFELDSVREDEGDAETIEVNADSELDVSPSHLKNERLHVDLNDDGTFSVFDRDTGRELFDEPGNRLVSYRDQPEEHDAWDIEGDLYAVGDPLPAPTDVEVIETGPIRATVEQTREFGESTLVQRISLERGSQRIDIRNDVEWHEEERFLKTHFPVDVHAHEATYDIQFGHLERDTHDNTSWDEARFEEPHQQWVDVSERDFGVAVVNDCKYGVHVDGTDISLSLLRAPNYPDPEADRGHHTFQYSVYPHAGDLREGGVVKAGYEVNAPVTTRPVENHVEHSLLEIDQDGVVVEAVKRAEDDEDALVLRLYEAWGRQAAATVTSGFSVQSAALANLVEDHDRDLTVGENGRIELEFDPFEIQTVVLKME